MEIKTKYLIDELKKYRNPNGKILENPEIWPDEKLAHKNQWPQL